MRIIVIIFIMCLGYGGWEFYQSRIDAKLDYKTMDKRSLPREAIELPYQECLKSYGQYEVGHKLCVCYANGLLNALTNDEFIAIAKDLTTKSPANPVIDGKIKNNAITCRTKYFGS